MIASILQLWPPTLYRFAGLAPGHNWKIDAIMMPLPRRAVTWSGGPL
jgi:hypothetical protein